VADDLHFHRNTITGRLDLAEKLRGRSLEEDRLGLGVALEITHFRGDEVLVQPR
jgi:DNA-binding PucR family transcriptional regulator